LIASSSPRLRACEEQENELILFPPLDRTDGRHDLWLQQRAATDRHPRLQSGWRGAHVGGDGRANDRMAGTRSIELRERGEAANRGALPLTPLTETAKSTGATT
jgi:hypothetical protein